MLKQPNMGLEEHLWAVLLAALCYVGLSIDDFLVMLWCREMHDWYLKPKCQELLDCFMQRAKEKEEI